MVSTFKRGGSVASVPASNLDIKGMGNLRSCNHTVARQRKILCKAQRLFSMWKFSFQKRRLLPTLSSLAPSLDSQRIPAHILCAWTQGERS